MTETERPTGIERSELERRIRDAVADVPGIAALLIFGSRARGTARPTSDLDLAVLPTAEEAAAKRRVFQTLEMRLHVAVAHLSPHPEQHVDVVRLDRAPETLRQRVMVEGRMLLCRDPAAWRALRVKTMREVGDRQWMRTRYRRALRRRLLEGRPSGRSARFDKPLERARRVLQPARGLSPAEP